MSANEEGSPRFNLFKLPYPVLRHFIDVLPVDDLVNFRQTCQNAHDVSKFRGTVIKYLTVSGDQPMTASSKTTIRTSYDKLVKDRTVIMPKENVTVIFNKLIINAQLLGYFIDRTFLTLTICGEYEWYQVLPLIHNKLTSVSMYGTCTMAIDNMEPFFSKFRGNKNIKIRIICDNANETWIPSARTTIYTSQHIDFDESVSQDGYLECTKFTSLDEKYQINMYFLYPSTKNSN